MKNSEGFLTELFSHTSFIMSKPLTHLDQKNANSNYLYFYRGYNLNTSGMLLAIDTTWLLKIPFGGGEKNEKYDRQNSRNEI